MTLLGIVAFELVKINRMLEQLAENHRKRSFDCLSGLLEDKQSKLRRVPPARLYSVYRIHAAFDEVPTDTLVQLHPAEIMLNLREFCPSIFASIYTRLFK